MSTNEVGGAELLSQLFSPRVAVLSTPGAEAIAQKNNLSLVQMLRPFARMRTEASLRDPYNNTVHEVRNLRLSFEDMKCELALDPTTVNQWLLQVVSDNLPKSTESSPMKSGNYTLNFNPSAPWFEGFRDTFIRTLPVSQHEFFRHFVACLLIVASNDDDPKAQFLNLDKQQKDNQFSTGGSDRWFTSDTLICRVLLHDVGEGEDKLALELIQELKSEINRGPHLSYLLSINSRRSFQVQEILRNNRKVGATVVDPWRRFIYRYSSRSDKRARQKSHEEKVGSETSINNGGIGIPHSNSINHPLDGSAEGIHSQDDLSEEDFHGLYLTSSDQATISSFIDEFIRKALLPHYEKQIRQLYEQLITRKTIHKSFFSATKKWLGATRTTAYPTHLAEPGSDKFYPDDAAEIQLRKLGDLAFIFQMYDIAYNIYYQCKSDFANDSAHLFHAGSLEMTALTQFMLGKPLSVNYIDTAISTYLSKECNYKYGYGLRCCLLCCEVLLARQMFSEAINTFIKLTTDKADLESALLLEQAAFCFVNNRPFGGKPRKFAFYMILAGHRFSRADHKEHTLRAYNLAFQIFRNSGWCFAEDHINLTVGKYSHLVGQLETSAHAYLNLVNFDERQTPIQQGSFFQDFLGSFKEFVDMKYVESKNLPEIGVPVIRAQGLVVTYGVVPREDDSTEIETSHWSDLEKAVIAHNIGKSVGSAWKPSFQLLNQHTINANRPKAIRQEPVTLKIHFENPLRVKLFLENMHLLWKFKSLHTNDFIENESDVLEGSKWVKTEVLKELVFEQQESKSVSLSLVPCVEGDVSVVGVAYALCSGPNDKSMTARRIVRVKQNLRLHGPKLNHTLEERVACARGPDYRLDFTVVPPQPLLDVQFFNLPTDMLCGEIKSCTVTLYNGGSCPISTILVSSKNCCQFAFGSSPTSPELSHTLHSNQVFSPETLSDVFQLDIPNGVLPSGEGISLSFWVRAMDTSGVYPISLLFFYSSGSPDPTMPHRIVRKAFEIDCRDSLSLDSIKHQNLDKSMQILFSMDNKFQVSPDSSKCEIGLTHVVCLSKNWSLRVPPVVDIASIREQEVCQFSITLDRIQSEQIVTSLLTISKSQPNLYPFKSFVTRNAPGCLKSNNSNTCAPIGVCVSTEENDLTIVFLWKCNYYTIDRTNLVFGQHHFPIRTADYESHYAVSPIPAVARAQNPSLPYVVRYGISFDKCQPYYLRTAFITIKVDVTFYNCCQKEIDVKLILPEAPTSTSVIDLESAGVRESFAFWWISKSNWLFPLAALECRTINLRATFFKAGTFNMNNFSVAASLNDTGENEFIKQDCQFASFITIERGIN